MATDPIARSLPAAALGAAYGIARVEPFWLGRAIWVFAIGFSIAVHSLVYVAAIEVSVDQHPASTTVDFAVLAQPVPADPEPEVPRPLAEQPAAAEPSPTAPPATMPEVAAASDDEPAEAAGEPASTDEPEPVDLTGVTLTGSGEGSWSSLVGNGRASRGPLGRVGRRRARRSTAGHRGTGQRERPPENRTVPVSDLSRPPEAPNLDGVLRQHYPKAARQAGVGGTAVVVARIGPDGQVRRVSIASESYPGFGVACQQTLLGSRWSPPRDRQGRVVSTEISYTCSFRVQR